MFCAAGFILVGATIFSKRRSEHQLKKSRAAAIRNKKSRGIMKNSEFDRKNERVKVDEELGVVEVSCQHKHSDQQHYCTATNTDELDTKSLSTEQEQEREQAAWYERLFMKWWSSNDSNKVKKGSQGSQIMTDSDGGSSSSEEEEATSDEDTRNTILGPNLMEIPIYTNNKSTDNMSALSNSTSNTSAFPITTMNMNHPSRSNTNNQNAAPKILRKSKHSKHKEESFARQFSNGERIGSGLVKWCREFELLRLASVEELVFELLMRNIYTKDSLSNDCCNWANAAQYGQALHYLTRDDVMKQVEILRAIQRFCVLHSFPKADDDFFLVDLMFKAMYEHCLVSPEAYFVWLEDKTVEHSKGKTSAIVQTLDWFQWLRKEYPVGKIKALLIRE